jgi:hypothetical protein
MNSMDNIIAILECLREFVVGRNSQKSFEVSTELLLEMIEVFGMDAPVMIKTFPFLEQIKNDVQQQKFDDALPTVLALLSKFRQAREYPVQTDKDSDVAPHALSAGVAPNERNHCDRETGEGEKGRRGTESNVVRLPLAVRHLDIAETLTAPGNQDIDAVTAGIERVQMGLQGSYLVVTWLTRATPSGYLDAIVLWSFGEELAARQHAFSAIDLLIAAGAKPEPTAKAFGPRLQGSGVPELARASVRVSEEGKPEEDHVSVFALGPFPAGIVGAELVGMFGNAREKRALKDLFAFYGSDGGYVPPQWLDEDLSPEKPGNPAWVLAQLQPLVGSKKEQLEWAETLITKLDTYVPEGSQIKTQEAGSVETKSPSERLLDSPVNGE